MKPLPGNLPYAFRDTTIESVSPAWVKEFNAEIADDNFLRGGKSILLCGEGAEHAARQWLACLLRAGFPAYRVTPFEAVRRISALPVLRDNEDRAYQFSVAECYLIDDLFEDHGEGLTPADSYRLLLFMRESIRDGAVLIAASDNEKLESDSLPDNVWEFVEENFEVIRGSNSEAKTKSAGIKKRKTNG
jgi:hypothetical protein